MYLLSILLLMIFCIGFSIWSSGANIMYYLDPASLILVLLLVLPVLISAGLFKDFNNAFRLSVSRKKEFTRFELLRAIEAVNLTIKALWASGIFHSIFGIVPYFDKKLLTPADSCLFKNIGHMFFDSGF